jgi:hypothetical protein
MPIPRHCEPKHSNFWGRANARAMTSSAKQSSETAERFWIASSLSLSCANALRLSQAMTNDEAIACHLTGFADFQLICPSCQSAAGVRTCRATPKHFRFPAIPRPKRGAYRDRHERKDAGQRWTRTCATDECARPWTAKSCGSGISTLMPSS